MENKGQQSLSELDNKAIEAHFLTVSKLIWRCFDSCVHDFSSKELLPTEKSCSLNCAVKYFAITNRLALRLQEEMELTGKPVMPLKGQGH